MAVGSPENSERRRYNGRMTSFAILSCIMAAMGGAIFGYDIGISGGVTSMEPFLKKFFPGVERRMREDSRVSNYCKFDSELLTSFTSSLYVAGFFATFVALRVTRDFGRRPSILVGGAAFLAGTVLGGAAVNVYMLILGRVLLGVGVGFTNQSAPLYLSEMAPPQYRGAISNGFQFSIDIGFLSATLVNFGTAKIKPGWGWRISLAMAAIPALLLTVGALFLPETPNSFIQRGNDLQKATELLQKIRGTTNVEQELHDLITASAISKTIHRPIRKIFERKYRPHLVMAIVIPFFQQVTGINIIAFYAPVLFRSVGVGENASLMSTVVIGLIGTSSTFVSMILVDRLGRRSLFMIGGVQMLVPQVVVGAIMALELGDYGGMSRGYAYAILVLLCVYVAGYGLSWGPLGWLIPSEIFPLEIRSVGQSINVALSFVFTFIVAQTSLAMLCRLKSGIFFFFGGWVIIMTVFVYLFLPETKNLPIEHVVRVWREHWFWKRFVGDGEETKMDVLA